MIMDKKIKSYAESGVNVPKIRKIQGTINNAIFKGKKNALIGHYAGIYKLGKTKFAMHCDGVGSKVIVAQQLGKYDTVGIDAIAMNVNDLVCIGAKPLAIVDYLALAKADEKLIKQIMKGLIKGAKISNVDIIGGETAILPDIIAGGKKPFDLAVTCFGVVENKLISGEKIKPGQIVLGLYSSGLHSNGYTLARKILDIKKWGKQMLKPTRIYSPCVLEIIKKIRINGIAHITGGAFSKLTRLTQRAGVGIELDNMPKLSKMYKEIANIIKDKKELYRTFNMGIGMVLVLDKKNVEKAENICKKYKIKTKIIGKVIKKSGIYLKQEGVYRLDF